jgi:zona occludens toxin (predicted ATPase)
MRSVSNSGIQSDEKGTQKKKIVFKSAKLGYFFVISFLNFAKKDKN